MKKLLLVLCVAMSACSTDSYIKEDGTQVTVKKAAGIPYVWMRKKQKWCPWVRTRQVSGSVCAAMAGGHFLSDFY